MPQKFYRLQFRTNIQTSHRSSQRNEYTVNTKHHLFQSAEEDSSFENSNATVVLTEFILIMLIKRWELTNSPKSKANIKLVQALKKCVLF